MRSEFEAWAMSVMNPNLDRYGDGQYRAPHIEIAWSAWQAATKAASEVCMEWQPIETAPRDETPILAWSEERGQRETQMGKYSEGSPGYAKWKDGDGPLNFGWVWDTHHNWLTTWNPTHWMPLPEAPNA